MLIAISFCFDFFNLKWHNLPIQLNLIGIGFSWFFIDFGCFFFAFTVKPYIALQETKLSCMDLNWQQIDDVKEN